MSSGTGIAVIEGKWWPRSNVSVRALFDLVSEMATDNPHGYHYEMANSEAALKEAIPRIAGYRHCHYLCLAMHGDHDGLQLLNGERLSRTELRNLLVRIAAKKGSKFQGLYLSACTFGTQSLADHLFAQPSGIEWVAGYAEEVDWLDSTALDVLFFNQLVYAEASTERRKISDVSDHLLKIAPGLVQALGFGIYVRGRDGAASNLLASVSAAGGA